MYRSGLVDTLVTHANTNGVWPNSLVRRPPWLYAFSVKNKNKQRIYDFFLQYFLVENEKKILIGQMSI
jgi:hypothetical protein